MQGEGLSEIRIPSGAGIAGSVFKSGEALVIPDAYADARFNRDVDRGTLFLHDARADELVSRVAEGLSVREIRIPAFSGIAGECFRTGAAIKRAF